jgi:hypothetical protein
MMTALQSLTIFAALIVGGTSLAIAQNSPATGGQAPGVRAQAPGPYLQSAAPPAQTTVVRHHKRMYMSTKHHRHTY